MDDKYFELIKENFNVQIDPIKEDIRSLTIEIKTLNNSFSELNKITFKNTIIVEEHHQRSVKLETIQKSITKTLETISNKVVDLDRDFKNISKELMPIKNHVAFASKWFDFFRKVPVVVRYITVFVLFGSAIFGFIKGIKETSNYLTKVQK